MKILHIGCNPGFLVSPDIPTLYWWRDADGSRIYSHNWAEYYGFGVLPPATWKYRDMVSKLITYA